MPVRNGRAAALAALGPASQPRKLGRKAGLIDENKMFRIKVWLALKPSLAPLGYVCAILLLGVRGFFLIVRSRRSRKRQIVLDEKCAP